MKNWWNVTLFMVISTGMTFAAEEDDWCVVTHPDHEKSATAQSGRAEAEKLFGLEAAASATSSEFMIPRAKPIKILFPGSRRGSRSLKSVDELKEPQAEKQKGIQKSPLLSARALTNKSVKLVCARSIVSLHKLDGVKISNRSQPYSDSDSSESESESDRDVLPVQDLSRGVPFDGPIQPLLLCAPKLMESRALVLRAAPAADPEVPCCEVILELSVAASVYCSLQVVQWWDDMQKSLQPKGKVIPQKVHLL